MTADGSGDAATGTEPAQPEGQLPLTVIVDAANVVGARPDGWWRDRAGAAARLHADLVRLAGRGLAGSEIVLVLEGAARAAAPRIAERAAEDAGGSGSGPVHAVRVVQARRSGDDEVALLAGTLPGRRVVVTADRELRRRCEAAGAEVKSPSWLYALL